MRQVKISSVQYEMLVALGKRWRMKPEDLSAELIEENYKTSQKYKTFVINEKAILDIID